MTDFILALMAVVAARVLWLVWSQGEPGADIEGKWQ